MASEGSRPQALKHKCVICGERTCDGYAVMGHIAIGNNMMYYCPKDRLRVVTLCKCANMLSVPRHSGNQVLVQRYEMCWHTDLDPAIFLPPETYK